MYQLYSGYIYSYYSKLLDKKTEFTLLMLITMTMLTRISGDRISISKLSMMDKNHPFTPQRLLRSYTLHHNIDIAVLCSAATL